MWQDGGNSFGRIPMQLKVFSLTASVSFAATLATLGGAQAQVLTGKVSSAQEPAMEGVLVNIKKEGTTVTTTVVTNDKGEYSFPNGRIEPGKYTITIRAAGYVLDGPNSVELAAGSSGNGDLQLHQTRK